jgi:hypothetical protein
VFSPHVSASVYVLRVHDPHGKFRLGPDRMRTESDWKREGHR